MAEPKTYTLQQPVTIGSETITMLTFTESGKALRGFTMQGREDGGMVIEPYALAAVGIRMAGLPEEQMLDRLGLADMMAIANIVLDFLLGGRGGGSGPSPS